MKKGNVKLEAAKKGNVKLVRGNFLQENEDDFEAQDLALKEENEETSLEEEENDNSEEEEEDCVSEEEVTFLIVSTFTYRLQQICKFSLVL